jgi:hypothetical protein
VDNLKRIDIQGQIYSLVVSLGTNEENIAISKFLAVYQMLKYYHKRNSHISFLIGLSNTEKGAGNRFKKVKQRNKIIIKGRKVPYHIHCIVIGTNAEAFTRNIVKRINKSAERNKDINSNKRNIPAKSMQVKSYKNRNDNGMAIIPYVINQCNPCFSYPRDGFNFKGVI